MKWAYLISGGVLGTLGRYVLVDAVHRWFGHRFPYGTLAVNVLGCLCIGFLASLAEWKTLLTPEFRLFWMVGLLGAFTTFSSLIYESGQLFHSGQANLVALNLFGSLALGLAAWWVGARLAGLL